MLNQRGIRSVSQFSQVFEQIDSTAFDVEVVGDLMPGQFTDVAVSRNSFAHD